MQETKRPGGMLEAQGSRRGIQPVLNQCFFASNEYQELKTSVQNKLLEIIDLKLLDRIEKKSCGRRSDDSRSASFRKSRAASPSIFRSARSS